MGRRKKGIIGLLVVVQGLSKGAIQSLGSGEGKLPGQGSHLEVGCHEASFGMLKEGGY